MNNLKTHNEFINEEINWKKTLAGTALLGSLLITPSCCDNKEPLMAGYNITKSEPIEIRNELIFGTILISSNRSYIATSKSCKYYTRLSIISNDYSNYFILIEGYHDNELVKGDKIKFVLTYTGDDISAGRLYKGGKNYKIVPFSIVKKGTPGETFFDWGESNNIDPEGYNK